jgi:putative sigma-54 modulation protein
VISDKTDYRCADQVHHNNLNGNADALQGECFMIVEFTGRHTTVTAKLKEQAQAGLERIAKVTNRCTSAHVILTEDKYRKIDEVTVQCRGESIVATCEGTEMESALHDALAKVEMQAVKHKEKFVTVRGQPRPVLAA